MAWRDKIAVESGRRQADYGDIKPKNISIDTLSRGRQAYRGGTTLAQQDGHARQPRDPFARGCADRSEPDQGRSKGRR
jgi:hypothetical protein